MAGDSLEPGDEQIGNVASAQPIEAALAKVDPVPLSKSDRTAA